MVPFGDISDGRRPVYPREYTYQLIFSPVVKSSGAVHFGLWSCWKGAGRPRLFLEVRITISPGVGCFFFLCFGSLLIFVGQRNFPLGFLLMFFYFFSSMNVGLNFPLGLLNNLPGVAQFVWYCFDFITIFVVNPLFKLFGTVLQGKSFSFWLL